MCSSEGTGGSSLSAVSPCPGGSSRVRNVSAVVAFDMNPTLLTEVPIVDSDLLVEDFCMRQGHNEPVIWHKDVNCYYIIPL